MKSRRKKIALLVPSSNTIMENDLHSALPKDRYTVHTDRMYLVETTREAEQLMLDKYARPAASDVGTTNPDLIVFGCTSAGSLFGLDYDAEFCAALGKLANCPALGVINAASRALSNARAHKVAVITPCNEDLTASVARALASDGREIVAAHGIGITVNVELADPENDAVSGIPGAEDPANPGKPFWFMAPAAMTFEKSPGIALSGSELCAHLKDKSLNGNRELADTLHHVATEFLVLWAWDPGKRLNGETRTTPPISHDDFVLDFNKWMDDGAPCPRD
jgi:maleate isomerase